MQSNDFLILTTDNLVQEAYKPNEPGAAVIIVRDGEVIYRKGQGLANLELGIPIEPDMVFRIGSLTKQFTAVAILMLAEQGKLALNDSITKFLPDYPTHDYLITVEHLLTHTSGIKSYTSMPEWLPLWRKDFTVQELIDFFKNQPIDFAPGKRFEYSNSGYILLGAIIEKASGQTYEQFIQHRIFEHLGMKHSCYDSPLRVIPRRAAGYDKGPDGYTNATYLSMTQPYSAGSLASSVDDLALWDAALYTGQLLKQDTLQLAFAAHRLADGSETEYGYGWATSKLAGHLAAGHGGGIHGFGSYAIRLPEAHIFVAALSNNTGTHPGQLALKIAAWAIGQPFQEPTPVELNIQVLARYEGVYESKVLGEAHVTREGNQLLFQPGQAPPMELVPFSSNEFFFKSRSLAHLTFVADANEVVTAFEFREAIGNPVLAMKVDKSALGIA
jgi:D-alanyl-D-alanine carboxypeptidase